MVALNFQIRLLLLMMNRCRFQDVYGVSIGGVVGHSMCTGLAVIGGRIIAQKISVRTGKHKLKKKKTNYRDKPGLTQRKKISFKCYQFFAERGQGREIGTASTMSWYVRKFSMRFLSVV